jgi:PAS domain S-box-containing protein
VVADVNQLLGTTGNDVFKQLVDSVTDYAIYLLTPQGIVATWNEGAARINGYAAAEVLGKNFAMFYTPDAIDDGWPQEELRRAAQTGHFEDEGWRVRKDGTRYWANAVLSAIQGSEGRLLGFSKVTRDLTDRRNQEVRVSESERHLRLLVDGVQDYAIFTLDTGGFITSWNLGAQRIKGYAAREAIGKHFSIFYSSDDVARDWPQEELRRARATGRYEDEGWRYRKDGSRIWANVVITAIFDEGGKHLGFSKVTRDLTERRRHENNLRLLVEGVKDHAMILLDREARVQSWNAGARRMFGYEEADILGRDNAALYPPDEQSAGRPQADLSAIALMGSLQSEGWRQRADGTKFWADVAVTALSESADETGGFVQIVRDLTETRRVQELESEGRRINEFIAMLSHELRNPLAPVRNAVSILKRFVDKPETVWCADVIERQVGHMTRLVDDLLDVSRVSTGKIRFERKALELNALTQAAADSVRGSVQACGQALSFRASRDPVPIFGDPTRLTQVLVNLLTNAVKYTPDGGAIGVEVDRDATVGTVKVVDTGIGMPEALLQRAFDPFVQGECKLDRAHGGLGIGLTLVKRIVESHGGVVTAASAGAGRGTTMTVSLPLAASISPLNPAQHAPATPCRLASILVVDDNKDAADSLAEFLRLSGHRVSVAHDGERAIEMARTDRPHIVLLDIGLPKSDGYQVARAMRQLPELNGIRLIAVTGYGQDRDRAAALEAGFDSHVTKPVDPDAILRLVDEHL